MGGSVTQEFAVEFEVRHDSEIPHVGHRRKVLVNGKAETLWCRFVEVWARRRESGLTYHGKAIYARDLWA